MISKHKEQILKVPVGEKKICHVRESYKVNSWLFNRNSASQKGLAGYTLKWWKGIKKKKRLLYLAKISFRFEGETKIFIDKQKLKRNQDQQTNFKINAEGTFPR